MVWISFVICVQGHTKEFWLLVTMVGNCWKCILSCFMQFLNRFDFRKTLCVGFGKKLSEYFEQTSLI